jgi:hypothetical protein
MIIYDTEALLNEKKVYKEIEKGYIYIFLLLKKALPLEFLARL